MIFTFNSKDVQVKENQEQFHLINFLLHDPVHFHPHEETVLDVLDLRCPESFILQLNQKTSPSAA